MNQPLMLAGVAVGFSSSMASTCGRSVCVRISLMTIGAGGVAGVGSFWAGDPKSYALGRQLALRSQLRQSAL